MVKMTIKDAILKVLSLSHSPMSMKEIYYQIIKLQLYKFKSKNPAGIVNSELRKSCEGIELKKSRTMKEFEYTKNGKFMIKK